MLGTLILIMLPLSFLADAEPVGWLVIPALVAPVLIVLVFWGLLLDLLMAWVFLKDSQDAAVRGHYRGVLKYDVLLLIALVAFWGRFYYQLVA